MPAPIKIDILIFLSLALLSADTSAVPAPALETPRVIWDKDTLSLEQLIDSIFPDSTTYRFLPPPDWGVNLTTTALSSSADARSATGLERLTDGDGFTAWTSAPGDTRAVLIFNWEKPVTFNRLVVFNRYTDAKGTAGGCNAVKTLVLEVPGADTPLFRQELNLLEPSGVCFPTIDGKHQVCFFIPANQPAILILRVKHTCFNELAWEYWADELTCALSEIMLFFVPPEKK